MSVTHPESGPTLLYLHGIGAGDPKRSWHDPLDSTLRRLGFPGLTDIPVVTPRYADLLTGGQPEEPAARISRTPRPRDLNLMDLRRAYDERQTRLEHLVGRHHAGTVVGFGDASAATLTRLRQTTVAQASRFVANADVRTGLTRRILDDLGDADDLVIVAHSLGTLVALNLLDHLPAGVRVRRLVTIGSPLGFSAMTRWKPFRDGFPYWRVESWVNVWNAVDVVSFGR